MADFLLWKKDTLVQFAEDASKRMADQEDAIIALKQRVAELEDEIKMVLREWREEVGQKL